MMFTKQQKAYYVGKFNQTILLFHRLYTNYFARINVQDFPKAYQSKLIEIQSFLLRFNPSKYEEIIREDRLKDKHIISLSKIVNELKQKKAILAFWDHLFEFEAFLSISLGIQKMDFSYPKITHQHLKLKQLYHPCLQNPVKMILKRQVMSLY